MKKGPRPARLFRIYRNPETGENYAEHVDTGSIVPLHTLTRVELIKTCSGMRLTVPEP